ncbi:MAG: hypothetical protein ACI9WU_000685 [Myxococcota bacterium]|jgi:hypothetical protein
MAALLLFAAPAMAQGDQLLIDHVDVNKYEKDGLLRFYVDIIDGNNQVVPEQDRDKLRFYLNDDLLPPDMIEDLELTTFRDVGEPIAVGILFTNYGGFIPKSVGEPSLFGFSKTGLKEFLDEFSKNKDWVGVWLYNEEANENIVPFTKNIPSAIDRIDELEEDRLDTIDDEGSNEGKAQAPNFYRYMDQVVTKMSELEDLPRRRILLVISDGVGEYTAKNKSRIDGKLKSIIETANDAQIKIYSFGAMLQENAFLPFLAQAAERTYGVYRRIDEPEKLEFAIRELAPQLKKQYVFDLISPGLPSEDKVKFRIDAETANGEKVSGVYSKAVKLPATPTNWKAIAKWVGIALGSLLFLFLFIKLIKKILAARRNRPEEVEWEEEEEEYDGPDRGKLKVRSGPQSGHAFPLLEDITTIGSIDGNHVVLHGEGVSKRHAGIKIEEMRYELADFGSTNGTWVNGRKINKQFLRDGDEIRIGSIEIEFTLK